MASHPGRFAGCVEGPSDVQGPVEIIVVDNGSTNLKPEIARASGIAVMHQPVRGPSAARNTGLARAQANIVACSPMEHHPFAPMAGLAVVGLRRSQNHSGHRANSRMATGHGRGAIRRHPQGLHPRANRRTSAASFCTWDERRRPEKSSARNWRLGRAMTSGEDMDFSIRLGKRFGVPIRFVDQAVLFHRHRHTDEALWKQARWHGASYAFVHHRHPDLLRWPVWRSGIARVSIAALYVAAPLVSLCQAARSFDAKRAEFERITGNGRAISGPGSLINARNWPNQPAPFSCHRRV